MRGRSGRGFGKGDECELEDFLRGIVEGVGGADW
jgi:hypothetical protein